MTLDELLKLNRIELQNVRPGRYYTTCPECSAKRKLTHQKNKCLVSPSKAIGRAGFVAIIACDATYFCGSCAKKVRTFCPRTQRRGEGAALTDIAFETGLLELKSPLPGNGISWAETKAPKRARRFKDAIADMGAMIILLASAISR